MMLLGFASVLVQSLMQSANSVDILVMGDSYAKHSENYLADHCAGKSVANFGVDSSLASDWANGVCETETATACSPATAAQGAPGAQFVWLSVGGNDFMMDGCMTSAEQLSQVIYGALATVKANLPMAKLVMTGYCTPPPSGVTLVPPTCQSPTAIGPLNDAVKLACEKTVGCTFVDATSACGGSRSAFSQPAFFEDPIHPNQLGYQQIFQLPGVQSAFSCGAPAAPAAPAAPPAGAVLPSFTAKYSSEHGGMLRGVSGRGKALTFAIVGLAVTVFAAAAFAAIRWRRRIIAEETIMTDEATELLD
jgi:lysophospholipase L1-like esterase